MSHLFSENIEILSSGRSERREEQPLLEVTNRQIVRKADDLCRLALTATGKAIEQLNFRLSENTGVIMATRYGPTRTTRKYLEETKQYGPELASAFLFPSTVPNLLSGTISLAYKLKGPSSTIIGGIDDAFEIAALILSAGRADIMIAGYADDSNGVLPGVELLSFKDGAEVYVLTKRLNSASHSLAMPAQE